MKYPSDNQIWIGFTLKPKDMNYFLDVEEIPSVPCESYRVLVAQVSLGDVPGGDCAEAGVGPLAAGGARRGGQPLLRVDDIVTDLRLFTVVVLRGHQPAGQRGAHLHPQDRQHGLRRPLLHRDAPQVGRLRTLQVRPYLCSVTFPVSFIIIDDLLAVSQLN